MATHITICKDGRQRLFNRAERYEPSEAELTQLELELDRILAECELNNMFVTEEVD